MIRLVLTLLIFAGSTLLSQEGEKYIYEGNNSYKSNNYKDAEIDYRKSLEQNPNSAIAKYNLANSLYRQGNYEEAKEKFKELSNENFSKREMSKVFHNLGNSLLENKNYEESIDAYINALKNNPKDEETKYNLAYAREMMRKQEKENKDKDKQDQNKDDQNKDKKDKDKNKDGDKNKEDQNKDKGDKDKDKKDQKQDEGDKADKDKQDKNKDGKDGEQDKSKPQKNDKADNGQQPKISKKDAERILQAMMNDEKELQKKLRKLKSNTNNTGKNW